jgi:hypothetical protein
MPNIFMSYLVARACLDDLSAEAFAEVEALAESDRIDTSTNPASATSVTTPPSRTTRIAVNP